MELDSWLPWEGLALTPSIPPPVESAKTALVLLSMWPLLRLWWEAGEAAECSLIPPQLEGGGMPGYCWVQLGSPPSYLLSTATAGMVVKRLSSLVFFSSNATLVRARGRGVSVQLGEVVVRLSAWPFLIWEDMEPCISSDVWSRAIISCKNSVLLGYPFSFSLARMEWTFWYDVFCILLPVCWLLLIEVWNTQGRKKTKGLLNCVVADVLVHRVSALQCHLTFVYRSIPVDWF